MNMIVTLVSLSKAPGYTSLNSTLVNLCPIRSICHHYHLTAVEILIKFYDPFLLTTFNIHNEEKLKIKTRIRTLDIFISLDNKDETDILNFCRWLLQSQRVIVLYHVRIR